MEAAIDESTAMIAIFGDAADRGSISVPEMVSIARRHDVPTFVDAAAERPDVPNPYLSEGVDVVAYSGGKCLRGPQASGLVLGRKDILHAAFMNGAPHHSLARPMKAGKEEVMGLLAAVEQWVRRDHAAEWHEWERRLETIANEIAHIPALTTGILQPGRSNVAPVLAVNWDPEAVRITPEEARRQLSDGDPRIELFHTGERRGNHALHDGIRRRRPRRPPPQAGPGSRAAELEQQSRPDGSARRISRGRPPD